MKLRGKMIKAIPLHDRDKFYQNEYINNLVDVSLANLDNKLFLNILHLIQGSNLKYVHKTIALYKSRVDESQKEIYNNIELNFDRIYSDELNKDNLRGAFLELIVHKFLNNKYSSNPTYNGAVHCNVEIFGNDNYKTVDVFAFCGNTGLVSENKVGSFYFENHDIENLNKIYVESEYYLKPYIITLATDSLINERLNEILQEDSSNTWVHCRDIKIVSASNIDDFFS